MLSYLLNDGSDIRSYIVHLLLVIPIILLALPVHEIAHGLAAKKLGDPTADSLGRLTLNPLKHFDLIGSVCMLLFGFGWAKPVPIDTRYFKKPRRDMAISALAGPIANILLALVFALLLKLEYILFDLVAVSSQSAMTAWLLVSVFFRYGIMLNISFAVFNLLPIPPLDGSRILTYLLPPKAAYWLVRYESIIHLVLFAALFIGVLDPVLDILVSGAMRLIDLLFGF